MHRYIETHENGQLFICCALVTININFLQSKVLNKPLVSICIPTYNRDHYLAQAIESALNQDYENIEVVVSDNCSSDNTQEVAKRFIENNRFLYYRNERNVGAVNNIKGLLDNKVTGEWFLILSDDDYLIDESYISKAMTLASQHHDMNMIYANGYIEHTVTNRKQELNLPYQEIEDGKKIFLTTHNVKPQAFTFCNILFKTHLSRKLGAFSNPSNLWCDFELFLKMSLNGKVGIVKNYASVYRFHNNNTITQKRSFEELIALATDAVIAPHVMAKEMGIISADDMKKREKTVVIPLLKTILFGISVIDSKLVDVAVSRLSEKDIEIHKIFRDPVFLFKIYLTKYPMLFSFLRTIKKSLSH